MGNTEIIDEEQAIAEFFDKLHEKQTIFDICETEDYNVIEQAARNLLNRRTDAILEDFDNLFTNVPFGKPSKEFLNKAGEIFVKWRKASGK